MAIGKQIPSKRDSQKFIIFICMKDLQEKQDKDVKNVINVYIKKKVEREYAAKKTKKVTTYCNRCKGQPTLCIKCFKKLHRNI